MRKRLRPVLASLLIMAAAAGCTVGPSSRPPLATYGGAPERPATTAPPATSRPTGPGGPGRDVPPVSWSTCRDDVPTTGPNGTLFDVDCGTVIVPIDYSAPDESTFPLRIARARAAGVGADAPVLVVIDGDPGQNGRTRLTDVAEALPGAVRDHFAVVVVDLRGTGDSLPVSCVSPTTVRNIISLDASAAAPGAADLLAKVARQLTFDCGDAVGPDLSKYNSTAAADDLDNIRAALGADTLSVLGTGFGATLGAIYADRYPGRVGRLVLDSPYDPLATPTERIRGTAPALKSALDSFAAACADFTGGCPLGADPRARVQQVISQLAGGPAVTSDGQLVSDGTVLLALVTFLGDLGRWPDLAAALAAAGDGRLDDLAALLSERFRPRSASSLLEGPIVYGCNDSTQRLPPPEAAAQAGTMAETGDLFGPYLLGLVALCSAWPAPEQPVGKVTGTGAAPILVIGAVDDPTTPYDGVRSVSGQLTSAVLLTWQSGQHGAYPGGRCVELAVNAYLLEGTTPGVGTLCPP